MAMNNQRDASSRYETEVGQIENIADTKGVELDDIEVKETETDDGDDLVAFRIYSEAGPKVQVSKMPNIQTGQMTFRDDVQNKLSALKREISGPDEDEVEDDDADTDTTDRSASHSRSTDGPGARIDDEIEAIHDRLDEFEERLEAVEEKSQALDGLKQLMDSDD
jgi:hypothetical protein